MKNGLNHTFWSKINFEGQTEKKFKIRPRTIHAHYLVSNLEKKHNTTKSSISIIKVFGLTNRILMCYHSFSNNWQCTGLWCSGQRSGLCIQSPEFESWYSQQSFFFSVELFCIYSQQYISLLHNSVCTFYWYKVSFGNWKMGKIIKSFLKDKLKRNSKFGHAQYMRII